MRLSVGSSDVMQNVFYQAALGNTLYSNNNNFSGGADYVSADGPDGITATGDEDFHLVPSSAAIDGGSSSSTDQQVYQNFWDTYLPVFNAVGSPLDMLDIQRDFDGNLRPVDGDGISGAEWDVGAFEFGSTP